MKRTNFLQKTTLALACLLLGMAFSPGGNSAFAQEAEMELLPPFEEPLTEAFPPDSLSPEQEEENTGEAFPLTFTGDENSVFVIATINVNPSPKSRTRPFAVIYNGEFKIGEEIKGVEQFEKYIKDKEQILVNQRVLTKSNIEYTIGEARADGMYPVHLEISVEDTWNIIALPQPKYSSNTGFELYVKARDYNFLGTMNPLRLNLGYKYDELQRNTVMIDVESDTPFRALGYIWSFKFNNSFNYRPDVEEPYYYKNTTGLSMELPFKATTFTFGVDESLTLNAENGDRYKKKYGEFQKGPFMSTNLSTSWKIPTGVDVYEYGDLTYTPSVSGTFYHELSEEYPLADFRKGPIARFGQSFGFGKIDWIKDKNYRKGLSAGVSSSHSFDFYRLSQEEEYITSSYSVVTLGHFLVSDFMGFSTRLQFRHWFYHDPEYYESAGDLLRGIIDKSVTADYMLSLNLDFPIKILSFMPSEWFNTRKLRFFNFEMHLSPIIDMALYHDPRTETSFDFKNILVSGGAEIIVFPGFMRSLYARLSFAWNFVDQINNPRDYYLNPFLPIVPRFPEGDNREIYFGIGHHY